MSDGRETWLHKALYMVLWALFGLPVLAACGLALWLIFSTVFLQ